MVRNKAGQMRTQQMAFMLIAITLFFILVGLFFLSSIFSGMKKGAESLEEKEAALLVSRLASSPEFSCGLTYGSIPNCVDGDKIIAFMENIQEYEDFYGIKNIEIRKVYPSSSEVCTRQNYPNCGLFVFFNSNNQSLGDKFSYVSLCRKELKDNNFYNKCEIARISVRY